MLMNVIGNDCCQSFIMNSFSDNCRCDYLKKNPIQMLEVYVKYSDLLTFFTHLAQSYNVRPYMKRIEKQIISLAP